MRLLRCAVALLSAVTLGSAFVVVCPCPAMSSATRIAEEAHACCRKSEPALRSAEGVCCQRCEVTSPPAAESVPAAKGAAAASDAALDPAPGFVVVNRQPWPVFVAVSPPSASPPPPLRM